MSERDIHDRYEDLIRQADDRRVQPEVWAFLGLTACWYGWAAGGLLTGLSALAAVALVGLLRADVARSRAERIRAERDAELARHRAEVEAGRRRRRVRGPRRRVDARELLDVLRDGDGALTRRQLADALGWDLDRVVRTVSTLKVDGELVEDHGRLRPFP